MTVASSQSVSVVGGHRHWKKKRGSKPASASSSGGDEASAFLALSSSGKVATGAHSSSSSGEPTSRARSFSFSGEPGTHARSSLRFQCGRLDRSSNWCYFCLRRPSVLAVFSFCASLIEEPDAMEVIWLKELGLKQCCLAESVSNF